MQGNTQKQLLTSPMQFVPQLTVNQLLIDCTVVLWPLRLQGSIKGPVSAHTSPVIQWADSFTRPETDCPGLALTPHPEICEVNS